MLQSSSIRARDLFEFSYSALLCAPSHSLNPKHKTLSMRTSFFSHLSLLRALSLHHHSHQFRFSHFFPTSGTAVPQAAVSLQSLRCQTSLATWSSPPGQQLGESSRATAEGNGDSRKDSVAEIWSFDGCIQEGNNSKHLSATAAELEVKELEEVSEHWRRAKLAWLCKEIPAQKVNTMMKLLNAQRKWMKQEDATYVIEYCMRIAESETGFKVYRWMNQQQWFRFNTALATKLADYLGNERKFSKCREMFDDIINHGRVPSESTFHILIVAYLSAPVRGCLEEACTIYKCMIQLGGYQPRPSLQNSLIRGLVHAQGGPSKHHLQQAEFIFQNLVTSGHVIQEDIYGGLISLHSYQDMVDKERIEALRENMREQGIEEGTEVLVSILRACSKEGYVGEVEKAWAKLLNLGNGIPSQACVHKMAAYGNAGCPMKSLEIFREMQRTAGPSIVGAYHKIIEVLSRALEVGPVESLMRELVESGLKPLTPSYISLSEMYLKLNSHDKLEATFLECIAKCPPNRTIFNIYLDHLVNIGNLEKAGEVFNRMHEDGAIGLSSRSCNTILNGYISSGDYVKAEKIYDLMCQKKYEIKPHLMERLEYVLSLTRKVVEKPISLKLTREQREILVGLLLGGLKMQSDEQRRNHSIRFEFNEEDNRVHSVLKNHIYNLFHEWLNPPRVESDDIPDMFFTVQHSYFGFYADQFWPNGKPAVPKLIHRWLSPRVLAYWFMYGGQRNRSGEILLKVKGAPEGVEKIVRAFQGKSLDCRVKRKGRLFWIGFLGSDAAWFSKLTEPYILDALKEELLTVNFGSASDYEEKATSSCSESD